MDADKSAAFYDRIAPEYDQHLNRPGDVWVRGAFHEFVRARLPDGARVLDFGCGTGTDAAWYARQRHRVLAFDNSSGMLQRLSVTCAEAVERGNVEIWHAPYERFLTDLDARGPIHAVTANFAVVNLLPRLGSWFAALARVLPPDGPIFLSALNPLGVNELVGCRKLTRALWHALDDGVPSRGPGDEHFKYWPWAIGRAALGFRLTSVAGPAWIVRYDRGPRDWQSPRSLAERLEQKLWQTRPWSCLGRFVFMELRRCV